LSASNPDDVLQPGSILAGKYKIGRLLGRGGFGATYLAWDTILQVRVAIKEYFPRQLATRASSGSQVSAAPGAQEGFDIGLQKFLSEARTLAQFRDHYGVIAVFGFFTENGTGYMVMEYLDGCTLEHYLSSVGSLDAKTVLQILVPVADALRACHAVGLIHRDVSPENIFVTTEGRIKLLDFGAARFAIGSCSTNPTVILKHDYAPFEQYQRNGRQGPWTDIYALTGTLYRMLTGALPVPAPDRVAGTHLPSFAEKGINVSPLLQALLDKGLAVQPQERYQRIEDFLSDLQAIPDNPTPGWLERWKWPATLVATVCLAGVAASFAVILLDQPTLSEALLVVTGRSDQITVNEKEQEPRSDLAIGPIREYVRNAIQKHIQLRLAIAQVRNASAALSKLQGVSSKTETINQAIRQEETNHQSAVNDREDLLNEYVADVVWLTRQQGAAVDTAIRLEEDSADVAKLDARNIDSKTQISTAINQLKSDIRDQRQANLAQGAPAGRASAGGTQ